jgi:hypothetical protein
MVAMVHGASLDRPRFRGRLVCGRQRGDAERRADRPAAPARPCSAQVSGQDPVPLPSPPRTRPDVLPATSLAELAAAGMADPDCTA